MRNPLHTAFAVAAALLVIVSCSSQRVISSINEESNVYGRKTLEPGEKEKNSYTNIYSYLRGKVPGVIVNGTDIIIRGSGSVNSGSSPLIIVDGIETVDISYLNPQEVEKVEVIKDSSASMYGFRGANGVIKITTINGRTKQN